MKSKSYIVYWTNIILSLLVFTLTACGGGGGSTTTAPLPVATTLSGTVAAGAAVVGTVTIKDSSSPTKKEKTVVIAADGKYTVDVSDMTAPFAMRADGTVGGRETHLYSAATTADVGGTVNITPFTDLIIANIAGDIAANYFNSGSYTALSKADLDAAQTALTAKLKPVLTSAGLGDSIDLLRSSFSADHSGLDGVLDVLKVTVDPTTKTAEIKNIVNNVKISDDLKSKADSGAFTSSDATGVATGLTDVQAVAKRFDDFSALFATGLPASDSAALLAFFDEATFMHDGSDLALFLSDIATDPSTIGLKFSNVSVVALDQQAGTGEVSFDVIVQGRLQAESSLSFKLVKKNNVWLMQGNQHIAKTEIFARSMYFPGNTTAQIQTGLMLDVSDQGGKGIAKAIVKGPGLPTAGVTLINDVAFHQFTLQGQLGNTQFVTMDNATVDSIPDGATYSIELRNAADAVMATYTTSIRKRPFKLSELSAASFPAITAPTVTDWRAFSGGSVSVTWTIPAGFNSDYVFAFVSGPGGNAQAEKFSLAPTTTTTTLTIQPQTPTGTTFTISNRNLEVGVIDSSGRSLSTNLF